MAGEYVAIQTAVESDIKAFLIVNGVPDVQLENEESFIKPDNTLWGRITIIEGSSQNVCNGKTKTYRQLFIAEVQLFAPLGSGKTDVDTVIGKLYDEYAHKNIVSGGAEAKFQAPSSVNRNRNRGAFQKNVSLNYQVDFNKTI